MENSSSPLPQLGSEQVCPSRVSTLSVATALSIAGARPRLAGRVAPKHFSRRTAVFLADQEMGRERGIGVGEKGRLLAKRVTYSGSQIWPTRRREKRLATVRSTDGCTFAPIAASTTSYKKAENRRSETERVSRGSDRFLESPAKGRYLQLTKARRTRCRAVSPTL